MSMALRGSSYCTMGSERRICRRSNTTLCLDHHWKIDFFLRLFITQEIVVTYLLRHQSCGSMVHPIYTTD